MNDYLNKKVRIVEKRMSDGPSSIDRMKFCYLVGTITRILDDFIELDNKTLVNLKYIYTIEILD